MNMTNHAEVNRLRTPIAVAIALISVVCIAIPIRAKCTAAVPDADTELPAQKVDLARREAIAAKPHQVAAVRAAADEQRLVADQVRRDAGAAHGANAEQNSAELQSQVDLLHAKPGRHALLLALSDVLFTSGRADLKPGAVGNLDKLVNFLAKNPDRIVAIHGYTDSVGSEQYNQRLSERRANSVRAYLAAQGIDSTRLSASGSGRSDPVAGNDSGNGRQQNRRVEVIISNPPAVVTPRTRTAKMIALLLLLESVSGSSGRPIL